MAAVSGYKQGPVISKLSAGTFTKGHGLILDSAAKWALPGAGGLIDAVALDDAADTDLQTPAWQVMSGGEVEVLLGATVVAGERLSPAADGTFHGVTSGEISVLKALAGGATGERIRAMVVAVVTAA